MFQVTPKHEELVFQVVMINLLTRYARSELADPELLPQPDVDLTLLLNSARPLLQVVSDTNEFNYMGRPKSCAALDFP